MLFDLGRAQSHNRALAQLESRLYDGASPLTVSALPETFNPFRWKGVIETNEAYILVPVNVLSELDTGHTATFYKPAPTDLLSNAMRTEPFRDLLSFARFPILSAQSVSTPQGDAKRIELTDLRFGTPGMGSFHAIALASANGQVLRSWFTFGSGSKLGWTNK